jgi:hypothetical protein
MAEEKPVKSPEAGVPEQEIATSPEAVEKQLEAEIEFVKEEAPAEVQEAPGRISPPSPTAPSSK